MDNELAVACRYFVTYSGIKLPFKLSQPLKEAELRNRNSYFRAWMDAEDRMTAFQKMVYGEIELEHRYQYYDSGVLERAEIIDGEGHVTLVSFDESGARQS